MWETRKTKSFIHEWVTKDVFKWNLFICRNIKHTTKLNGISLPLSLSSFIVGGGTWERATMWKWWAKMSTSLPLPSSPHWQPNTPDTWLNDPIRLASSWAWVTLKEEPELEQTMTFGRRGRVVGLCVWLWWAPKKAVLMGFESSAMFILTSYSDHSCSGL